MREKTLVFVLCAVLFVFLSGCATTTSPKETQHSAELESEVASLKNTLGDKDREIAELNAKNRQVAEAGTSKEQELSDMKKAMDDLARSLQKEIGDYKAKLEMTERGLVITFLAEVFFDSGKDAIRSDGAESLKKVAEVLNKDVPDSLVAIEGHTDAQPIKYSGWKSNWELSSARALAVLHYFVNDCQVRPERLSANGYGEYRPIAPNDTPENMQKNRRVEIVIIPPNRIVNVKQ